MKRRTCAALVLIGTLAGPPVLADTCKVEDSRWYHRPTANMIVIQGATTCAEGILRIRAYAGTDEAFIGIAKAMIKGYTFEAFIDHVEPHNSLKFRYLIQAR